VLLLDSKYTNANDIAREEEEKKKGRKKALRSIVIM
jgi:hypothetical protein